MKKEVKICMPYYKIAYSIAFVVILSAIQPVVYANEIGQAVERAVSLLAVVFCADTYLVEVQSKRSEVFCLYNLKKQAGVVYKRLFVQVAYLIGISLLAYGLFYWQKPVNLTELKKTLEKIKEELFVEQRGKNSLSLEKILKDILDGEYEKNERLDAVLADNYGIIQGHSLYCMYIFLGKYYESEKKEVGLFLEELKEHNPERKLCWLPREKQQAALVCFYGEEDVSKLLKYVKHSVVPACSVRLHDRGVFTWKECKGLNRLTETELELEKACGWHLILGDRVLIECEKILQMRTYQFIYPAELENRARSAVIHMNAEEFTGCFQKFMKYGRIEVHSPQELREVCIRFAYAIINTAKECGTLRDEELMVQRVLKTILGAVSWEEIEAVMMELFSSIEISQINQTSSEYLVQKALTIMKECYSDGITLEETARRLHVTEQYLGTQLKKETGTSFTETVRKFKIMHVKELLLDTDLKLNQIAAMTGFSNPAYFAKIFRRKMPLRSRSPGTG